MATNFQIRVKAILEHELYSTPPLMPVVVARLVGTQHDIPRAFSLTKDVSASDLKHLRRIRNLPDPEAIDCILCRSRSVDDESRQLELDQLKAKFLEEKIFEDYRIINVPSKAPRTEHQLAACMRIWPCKYAKSNYLIKCIEGCALTPIETDTLRTVCNQLVAYMADQDEPSSGAVVFQGNKVRGVGMSNEALMSSHPVKHSTMLAIDSVATQAGSGHWKDNSHAKLHDIVQKRLDDKHIPDNIDNRTDNKFLPYLCTDYDILVTEEPCFMCTMGLVQSRIRRLFYIDRISTANMLTNVQNLCYPDGAIERFLVHRDKNLNHRFEVWKVTLIDDGTT